MVGLVPRFALALVALAFAAQSALAAPPVQHNPHGKFLGVVKHRGQAGAAAPAPSGGNLSYHGGPVMHANRTHAIFWGPSGSFPSSYVSLVSQYFTDVAHDSGLRGNVYSTDPQYPDRGGAAAYDSTFGGAIMDTDAYPSNGCTPQGSHCLSDAQLQTEVDAVISANGLSRGLGDIYFVFTPSGVDSCFGTNSCSYNIFCAYHSNFSSSGTDVLYADMPFPDLSGCDNHQHPNGDAEGDSIVSVTSHEHNETVTDPTGEGWWQTSTGDEDGDKCNFNFGSAIGTAPNGASFNQLINGDRYYLQQEWSNSDSGCVQREDHPPVAHIGFTPSTPLPGQQIAFDGTTSTDSDGTIDSYSWSFGDGSSGTGSQPTHTYPNVGTYTVTLTVTDNDHVTGKTTTSVLVDTAPSCSASSATVIAGSSGPVSLPCSDADSGDTLIRSVVTGPSHGTLGAVNQGAGTVTYTPASGYIGPDSFTFRATDNHGRQSAAATATITVNTTQPACADTSATAPQDGSVTVTLPCGGSSVSRAIVTQPAHGTLGQIDQAAGTVLYTPNPGYSGPDTFTFDTTDGNTTSAPATASITVQPPPPPAPSGGGGGTQTPSPFAGTPSVSSPPLTTISAPRVSGLHVAPSSLHRGSAASIRWLLNVAATTAFKVARVLPGVVSSGRCVKPRAHDSRRHCRRFSPVRSFSRAGVAGHNSTRLSTRGLAVGLYRLTAVPTDSAGNPGVPVRTSLRVTR